MKAYLSVIGADAGAVPVEDRVEIYRDPGDTERILAMTPEKAYELGVKDITVSRLKNETPPVVVEARHSSIEIRNENNTNGVEVNKQDGIKDLSEGRILTISDTAVISLGYQTEIRIAVEREAKTEFNIDGSVEGDVVGGDQTNIDRSTNVVDSVVNRSDISGEGDGETVEDSVVNRSSVSERESGEQVHDDDSGDTQNRCDKHDRLYTSDVCPECAAEKRPARDQQTKYCMFCGTEITFEASVCPDCGEEFPD